MSRLNSSYLSSKHQVVMGIAPLSGTWWQLPWNLNGSTCPDLVQFWGTHIQECQHPSMLGMIDMRISCQNPKHNPQPPPQPKHKPYDPTNPFFVCFPSHRGRTMASNQWICPRRTHHIARLYIIMCVSISSNNTKWGNSIKKVKWNLFVKGCPPRLFSVSFCQLLVGCVTMRVKSLCLSVNHMKVVSHD